MPNVFTLNITNHSINRTPEEQIHTVHMRKFYCYYFLKELETFIQNLDYIEMTNTVAKTSKKMSPAREIPFFIFYFFQKKLPSLVFGFGHFALSEGETAPGGVSGFQHEDLFGFCDPDSGEFSCL